MNKVTFDNVKIFTVKELWDLKSEITENTSLAHDFAIAGLDGKEYMDKYSKTFNVNLGNFNWIQYFGEEGTNPMGIIYYFYKRFIKNIPAREICELPEITLGHLVKCANLGKWVEP